MRSYGLVVVLGGIVAGVPGSTLSAQGAESVTRLFLSPMGEIVRAEGDAAAPEQVWFTNADIDSSGTVDLQEMQQDAMRFFQLLDVDQSGDIGPAEITRYETEIAPAAVRRQALGGSAEPRARRGGSGEGRIMRRREGNGRQGPSGSSRPRIVQRGGPGGGGLMGLPQPVAMADTDMNRRITENEFKLAAQQRWENLDRNKDGRLALDELPSRPARR